MPKCFFGVVNFGTRDGLLQELHQANTWTVTCETEKWLIECRVLVLD